MKELTPVLIWLYSLSKKIIKMVPAHTAGIVVMNLVSQFTLTIASFMPLKVVIILGANRIPHYFPASFQNIDKNMLVLWLTLAAGMSYLLHLLSEKIIRNLSAGGGRLIGLRNDKIALFDNQEELTANSYARFSDALSSLVFMGMVFALMGYFHGRALWFNLFFMALITAGFIIAASVSKHINKVLSTHLVFYVDIATTAGFLGLFCFIVFEFYVDQIPSFMVALATFILSKQFYGKITGMVKDVVKLHKRKPAIDALFFKTKTFTGKRKKGEDIFWSLMDKQQRQLWVKNVLPMDIKENAKLEVNFLQSNIVNILAFDVKVSSDKINKRYLVKLFHGNRTAAATHEALLLQEEGIVLPTLKLVITDQVEGFRCHVFEVPVEDDSFLHDSEARQASERLFNEIARAELSKTFVSRYTRSRPGLGHQLDKERLKNASNRQDVHDDIDVFFSHVDDINARLKKLPLIIINPDANKMDLVRKRGDVLLCSHWGGWSLVPFGSTWPAREESLEKIQGWIESHGTDKLKKVNIEDALLAAYIREIEGLYQKQRYRDLFTVIQSLSTQFYNRKK
ncbi:hypothetical protein SAMN05421848_1076 [Kushneria avicenniae]|uniref:Uncharacterized protein n=1 Tax=Kushneria avicenniae TaxID=402385 RepID=A0A1I1IA18_9GAMM|nr:hypothetical protein [Kushneria avicenniae]SFC32622.1 hypothetical protein SAMN05421848_1076 [Kushneria avicenniae]